MMGIVFSIITAIAWWLLGRIPWWLVGVAITFFLLAALVPWILMPLNRLWGQFAARVSIVSNFIILGVVMYGVFAPIGFVFRLLRRDTMARNLEAGLDTYLTPVPKQMNADNISDWF